MQEWGFDRSVAVSNGYFGRNPLFLLSVMMYMCFRTILYRYFLKMIASKNIYRMIILVFYLASVSVAVDRVFLSNSADEPDVGVILNNNAVATSRSSWFYKPDQTPSKVQIGQTFLLPNDAMVTAIAIEASSLSNPIRQTEGSNYVLTFFSFTDANDIEPDEVLRCFAGTIPNGFDSEVNSYDWLTFQLNDIVELSGNKQYGFFLEWVYPAADRIISVGHSPGSGETNPYAGGRGIKRIDGQWTAIGDFEDHRDLNFAVIGCPGSIDRQAALQFDQGEHGKIGITVVEQVH